MHKITTFLMFEGKAEEAMNLYLAAFPNSAIRSISRYGPGEDGTAGSVRHAVFSLNGQEFMCIDSSGHDFTFTPTMSLHVQCSDEAELDRLFAALSEGGKVLMELAAYPFARKYAWINDRYGVSWQLSLPAAQT
jgi:predicted 3-demethylubiquinone-9 3-methyltransferase (glyoxalase superfamily)